MTIASFAADLFLKSSRAWTPPNNEHCDVNWNICYNEGYGTEC